MIGLNWHEASSRFRRQKDRLVLFGSHREHDINQVMSATAVFLIVSSAIFHAAWNYLGKRQNPSIAFFSLASLAAAIVLTPILLIYRQTLPVIPAAVWILIFATGVAQAVYYSGLAGAYKLGDLSLAYPLVRALPVLLIAGISLASGKGADIRAGSLLGMLFIAAGCIILPMSRLQWPHWREYMGAVYLMVLIAAVGTTGYTMIDDEALRQLRQSETIGLDNAQITLLFVALQTSSTALILGVTSLMYRPQRRQLGSYLQQRSLILSAAVTGLVIAGTYGLVLAAMAYVSNVSYVAAFRQLSIPIGAFLGITLQHEARLKPKLVGIGIILVGLILVGLG